MIIDSHAHLGDVLYGKNITFKQNVVKRDHHNFLDIIEANDFHLPESLMSIDHVVYDDSIRNEEEGRNNIATLQNLQNSIEENNIDKVWILPVMPHIGFEEVLAASKLDDRVVPFTGIDFALPEKDAVEKALKDAQSGAMGLKVHPVMQQRQMNDSTVLAVLQAWQATKKPVVFHTYSFNYYPPDQGYRNSPEFGSNPTFVELAREFPSLSMIAAHSGGPMDFPEILAGKEIKNLFVDTSFQPAEVVSQFVDGFGPERVLFGTDWPWGFQDAPIRVIHEVCKEDKELQELLFYKNAMRLMEV